MFQENDLVTRKSYNHDIIFKIVHLKNNYAILQGKSIRLCATCYVDDLVKVNEQRDFEEKILLPIENKNYLNGKVLHIDGDVEYLKKSMKLYEEYKVPAIGYKINENKIPEKIEDLLIKHNPDILIITGHDALDKNGSSINSSYFVEAVKKARQYQPNKDSLCIISGACYSSFKDLILQGSNISSSPGKVSINVLDPAKVAIMVATTPVFKYVNMTQVLNLTSNKTKGMGGIDTKGLARKIY